MNKEHNYELFNNMKMAFPVYEFKKGFPTYQLSEIRSNKTEFSNSSCECNLIMFILNNISHKLGHTNVCKVNIILIFNDYKITKLQVLNYIDAILRIWIGLTEQSSLIGYPISYFIIQ